MRLRPRTRLYSVTDEGPRMRRRCGRWSIGLACTDESSSSSCCYPYIKNAKVGDREQGKLTLKFGSSSSSLRPCHSPAPPKSARHTRRSSKNRCAGAQSSPWSSRTDPPASGSSGAYISCASALSAATCCQERRRTGERGGCRGTRGGSRDRLAQRPGAGGICKGRIWSPW